MLRLLLDLFFSISADFTFCITPALHTRVKWGSDSQRSIAQGTAFFRRIYTEVRHTECFTHFVLQGMIAASPFAARSSVD